MSELILEQQRRYHEELERIVQLMVGLLVDRSPNRRDRILTDYRLKSLLDTHRKTSCDLLHLYEDSDGARKDEVKRMGALGRNFQFSEFYKHLNSIKCFHRQHPGQIESSTVVNHSDNQLETAVFSKFTDEEDFGQYLDLHEHHQQYLNVPAIMRIDYIAYLSEFDHLFDVPIDLKRRSQYSTYLRGLVGYLEDFVRRTRPLFDVDSDLELVRGNFENAWRCGTFPGWVRTGDARPHLKLSEFSSVEQLLELSCEHLKDALQSLGLKCGGTHMERAERLFATKLNRFDRPRRSQHAIAWQEAQVYRYGELLVRQRYDTRDQVQRRQARSKAELNVDNVDSTAGDEDDSTECDEATPYNPKNLPVGFDGRPIPYWLYKLHGLNLMFVCEICGNFRYRGPKAYQLHFVEWRHGHGMRCLGIPNTAHFAGITQIEDALALWERLKIIKTTERWNADEAEEFEDSCGNVLNRKLYRDLERQGVL